MNPGKTNKTRRPRPGLVATVATVALVAVGCIDPHPPTTTTSSTTSTSTTSTSTIPCDDYTPTNLAVSNTSPGGSDTVIVSGNGAGGSTVVVTLTPVAGGSSVDPGVSAPVDQDGTWSTSVNLPGLASGEWDVVATVSGSCSATARVNIS